MDYRTIIREFASLGLSQASLLTAPQVQEAMNKLVKKNTHQPMNTFNIEVSREIWDQCGKNNEDRVNLRDYAQVVIEAKEILEGRVREVAQKLQNLKTRRQQLERQFVNFRASNNEAAINDVRGQLESLEQQINQTELDQQDYQEDYRAITSPFVNDANISRQNLSMNRSLLPPNDPYNFPNMQNNSMRSHSQIFMKRSSGALTMIFYLALLAFFLELFIMIHKVHFMSILSIIGVLAIFGLNYFDRSYIKIALGALVASVVMDVLWILFYMGQYASPGQFSQNSMIHTAWLRFTLFIVIVNAVIKAIIFLILMGYRNVQEVSSISVFGYSISLSGECLPLRNWDLVR